MSVRIVVASALLLAIAHIGRSQTIEGVDFEVQDNKIVVTYTLLDCDPDKTYDVALFYWQNHKVKQAITIDGDIRNQECGSEKRIVWDVLTDRTSLSGDVQMEVRKIDEHKIYREKHGRRKDHGYVAINIGGFTPRKNFTQLNFYYPSDNLQQPGATFEITGSWLGRRQGIMGYTSTIRFATTQFYDEMALPAFPKTTWMNGSFTFGPLFSIPISRKIVWDIRPMLGYAHTFVTGWSDQSMYYNGNYDPVDAGNLCIQLGTAVRFNVAKWMNLVFSGDYFETQPRFSGNTININYINISFGCGVRF